MGSSKAVLSVLIALGVPPALAQALPSGNDDLKATMRVMSPGADSPDAILRRIPPPRAKKPGVNDDAPAKDLANPDHGDGGGGSAVDPGLPSEPPPTYEPTPPIEPGPTVDPVIPTDPILPDVPGTPDPLDRPGDFGHGGADDARGRGEDARRHGKPPKEDKPPRGPRPEPPGQRPPRDRDPPGQRPPRDRDPPGQRPPRDRDPPRGPRPPRE